LTDREPGGTLIRNEAQRSCELTAVIRTVPSDSDKSKKVKYCF
jgi:hypothetical protein